MQARLPVFLRQCKGTTIFVSGLTMADDAVRYGEKLSNNCLPFFNWKNWNWKICR